MKIKECKECPNCRVNWLGDVGCSVLHDWITREEYKDGKKVLDNCPKKEEK